MDNEFMHQRRWLFIGGDHGPYSSIEMNNWLGCNCFDQNLKLKLSEDSEFYSLAQLVRECGVENPFVIPGNSYQAIVTNAKAFLNQLTQSDTRSHLSNQAMPSSIPLAAGTSSLQFQQSPSVQPLSSTTVPTNQSSVHTPMGGQPLHPRAPFLMMPTPLPPNIHQQMPPPPLPNYLHSRHVLPMPYQGIQQPQIAYSHPGQFVLQQQQWPPTPMPGSGHVPLPMPNMPSQQPQPINYTVEILMDKAWDYLRKNDSPQSSEKAFQAVRLALAQYVEKLEKYSGKIVPDNVSWNYYLYGRLTRLLMEKHPNERILIDLGWDKAITLHKVGWCQMNLSILDVQERLPDVGNFVNFVDQLNYKDDVLAEKIRKLFEDYYEKRNKEKENVAEAELQNMLPPFDAVGQNGTKGL